MEPLAQVVGPCRNESTVLRNRAFVKYLPVQLAPMMEYVHDPKSFKINVHTHLHTVPIWERMIAKRRKERLQERLLQKRVSFFLVDVGKFLQLLDKAL